MPVSERWAYFDHAAVGPLPRPTAETIERWLKQAVESGDVDWLQWKQGIEQARKDAARLISAEPDEIALVNSTTQGINFVAEGINWRAGDNIVVLADEYPSNMYPWIHQRDRGVETRAVPTERGRVDLDQLRAACDNRTRLVSISWVGFSTGARQHLDAIAEIAHSSSALFFVDAIQGMGIYPIDVSQTPIDFLAADGHKWMLGPEGAGFAYIRRKHLDRLRTIGVGSGSVVNQYDYSTIDYRLKPSAARYEGGSANMVGLLAWGTSLQLLMQWSPKEISHAVLSITDLACERLREADATIVSHRDPLPCGHDLRSGIVSFELPGRDPMAVRKACLDAGVVLSCRAGRLRISAHAYNSAEDVDRLIDAIKN